ncbi:hypothetical protein [Cohnella sp. JJ-181]|uniref:hypothetical protein n=1 Tax=Cohnella rhizoplanae TaxID=2974897 RepID=UPI0022FFA897|nr:hypothetical protein [Cohnella sp. JJ-181]CAI6082081.1 hypothetical protein COHCIP112018_03523 [Cohnella sp. JJ-181]
MIAWSRLMRSLIVGIIVAALAIGLLPFLFADLIGDLSGLNELDSSPFYTLMNKFIRWGK